MGVIWRRARLLCVVAGCVLATLVAAGGGFAPRSALALDDPKAQEQSSNAATSDEGAEASSASDQVADDEAGAKADDSGAQAQKVTPAVEKKIATSVLFVGTDGTWAEVTDLSLDEGASAWDATRAALTRVDLDYRTGTESAQDVIVSITRREDGATQGLDSSTGSGWHLYLNGERYLGSSSSVELADGDEVAWRYEVGTIMVSVSVVGPGGAGDSYWIAPTSVRMQATQTAWDASLAVFEQSGYGEGRLLSYTTAGDGSVYLESLAALGENGITGEAWQAFVNGSVPETDVAHILLHAGDSICWYYAGRGVAQLPDFVAQTGAASQNPAASVSIDGLVAQAWTLTVDEGADSLVVVDRLSGLSLSGQGAVVSLVKGGVPLADPLAQCLDGGGWGSSLAYAIDGRLATGEGVRSAMESDRSLYYLDAANTVVKLELR